MFLLRNPRTRLAFLAVHITVTGKVCRYVDAKILGRCCDLKFEAVEK